jgi:hypothetical protein
MRPRRPLRRRGTRSSPAFTFIFLTRAAVLDLSATQLQRMQEMRDSKLLVKVLIDLNDAFQGKGRGVSPKIEVLWVIFYG